jgi:hypothetical protein
MISSASPDLTGLREKPVTNSASTYKHKDKIGAAAVYVVADSGSIGFY